MIFRKSVPLIIALAASLVIIPAACRREKGSPSGRDFALEEGEKKDAVVLQVGGTDYFLSNFENYVRRTMGGLEEPLSATALSRLFDRFVEDNLLLEKARSQRISLTEEEMKNYLVKVKNQVDLEKDADFNEADLKGIRDKLLVDKYTFLLIKDISIGDDELKAYYGEHKSDFLQPERFGVSQILTDSEETAVEVLNRVRGKSLQDFEQAARETSIGVEAVRGGRMGVFSRGQLPFEIERVILSLEQGQISRVVESSYGYHIFLLTQRIEPELVSLEKAAPGIRLKLLDQKIGKALAAHLEEVKKSPGWRTLSRNLPFDYQRNLP